MIAIGIQWYLYEHLGQDLPRDKNGLLSGEDHGQVAFTAQFPGIHQIKIEYRFLHLQEVLRDQLY